MELFGWKWLSVLLLNSVQTHGMSVMYTFDEGTNFESARPTIPVPASMI